VFLLDGGECGVDVLVVGDVELDKMERGGDSEGMEGIYRLGAGEGGADAEEEGVLGEWRARDWMMAKPMPGRRLV
jgi:hypothetical protein